MKKRFAKTLFFAAAVLAFSAAAQEDLLKDGLKGWKVSNRQKVTMDAGEKNSLRLENGSIAARTLKLEPDSIYKLSFSVKGKEISSGQKDGARVTCHCVQVKKWLRLGNLETGTFDWKADSDVIDTAAVGGSEICLEFRVVGSGTAWYDGIKLTKLKKVPSEWMHVNPKLIFADTEVKLSEEYSLRLEGNPKTNLTQTQKLIELEPGVQYELTYFLKGKEITSGNKKGACMLVCGADRKRWVLAPCTPKGYETGTFEWKPGRLKFTDKFFGTNKILILPDRKSVV